MNSPPCRDYWLLTSPFSFWKGNGIELELFCHCRAIPVCTSAFLSRQDFSSCLLPEQGKMKTDLPLLLPFLFPFLLHSSREYVLTCREISRVLKLCPQATRQRERMYLKQVQYQQGWRGKLFNPRTIFYVGKEKGQQKQLQYRSQAPSQKQTILRNKDTWYKELFSVTLNFASSGISCWNTQLASDTCSCTGELDKLRRQMRGKSCSSAKIVYTTFVPFHLVVEFGKGLGKLGNLPLCFTEKETSQLGLGIFLLIEKNWITLTELLT